MLIYGLEKETAITHEDVRNKVRYVVSDFLDDNQKKVTPEKKLDEDLGIDSLALLDLLFTLDDFFQVKTKMDRDPPLLTVKDLENAVIEELSKQK